MSPTPAAIRECTDLDPQVLRREVLTSGAPCVLRGLVREWPAVRAARTSPRAAVEYLARFDSGKPVDAIMTPPEVEGRVFYNADMSGFNFVRNRLPAGADCRAGAALLAVPAPARGRRAERADRGLSARIRCRRIPCPCWSAAVQPRVWLGNAITTPTHLDEWNNIGCVVSGRRRFTLFPPEQVVNLYIGPLDFAPTGAPMSLVSLHAPDFARFPRFREALAAAVSAELGPGDAIFIPPLWWHHVESLEPFNLLVNYWWHAERRRADRRSVRLRRPDSARC